MNPGQTQQQQNDDSLLDNVLPPYAKSNIYDGDHGHVSQRLGRSATTVRGPIGAFDVDPKRSATEVQPTSGPIPEAFEGEMDEPIKWPEKVRLQDKLRPEDSNNAANQGPPLPSLGPNDIKQLLNPSGLPDSRPQLDESRLRHNSTDKVKETVEKMEIDPAEAYRLARGYAARTYEQLRGEGGKQAA